MIHTQDADFTLLQGDVLEQLATLPDESVHCVVTSPPYWALRDYGTGSWVGGNPDCEHKVRKRSSAASSTLDGGKATVSHAQEGFKDVCPRCGAQHQDRQLGLEPTPEQYVAGMVEVFREVRRVLRSDGTCWVNLGDSYVSGAPGANPGGFQGAAMRRKPEYDQAQTRAGVKAKVEGLKPKDLCGIPWRVAFALQQDGWCLRSDIVWAKPNPMPESVTDRPTKSHEMLFLLTKAKWIGPDRGRFADITDEDARWLALLFDAEGNVVIKKAIRGERTQYGAQVAFANTSRELIERAQAIVGMGSIHERPGTNAPVFYWQMTGQQARDLLYRIYPFLIVKPRQAALAIHMQDVVAEPKKRPGGYRTAEHTEFLDKCWSTMKALNSFEHPDISWVRTPAYGKWVPSRYFFDQEAVREAKAESSLTRYRSPRFGENNKGADPNSGYAVAGGDYSDAEREQTARNVRTVWEIATQPYPEAHFATYPEELVRRCVLAGSSERGCCPVCGKPWEREVESTKYEPPVVAAGVRFVDETRQDKTRKLSGADYNRQVRRETLGWRPGCDCELKPIPCTVLDPFLGSGTTAYVARRHGRRSIGIELNVQYADLAAKRMAQQSLEFAA